jgi:hypothetical protein
MPSRYPSALDLNPLCQCLVQHPPLVVIERRSALAQKRHPAVLSNRGDLAGEVGGEDRGHLVPAVFVDRSTEAFTL